jgi:hypothetical protein
MYVCLYDVFLFVLTTQNKRRNDKVKRYIHAGKKKKNERIISIKAGLTGLCHLDMSTSSLCYSLLLQVFTHSMISR